MDFTLDKPIYRQIIDRMGENIVRGHWREGERIPAVREFAVRLQVNPNTVIRAYESLQTMGALEMRRGIGYFVAEGARKRTLAAQREVFLTVELPAIFERMEMLGIEPRDIVDSYEEFTKRSER